MRQARRQLSRFLSELGPAGDKVLTTVVRGLGNEGRRTLRIITPVSAGQVVGRPRLRRNVKAKTSRGRGGAGARAFVWYSRKGLRFQQPLAVEHGAKGRAGRRLAAEALERVAGADGSIFRRKVIAGLEAATTTAAGRAQLRRGAGPTS